MYGIPYKVCEPRRPAQAGGAALFRASCCPPGFGGCCEQGFETRHAFAQFAEGSERRLPPAPLLGGQRRRRKEHRNGVRGHAAFDSPPKEADGRPRSG